MAENGSHGTDKESRRILKLIRNIASAALCKNESKQDEKTLEQHMCDMQDCLDQLRKEVDKATSQCFMAVANRRASKLAQELWDTPIPVDRHITAPFKGLYAKREGMNEIIMGCKYGPFGRVSVTITLGFNPPSPVLYVEEGFYQEYDKDGYNCGDECVVELENLEFMSVGCLRHEEDLKQVKEKIMKASTKEEQMDLYMTGTILYCLGPFFDSSLREMS